MGLLIKLQNGDTALKSLKFGKDRLGGGSSNQPYIKNPIIDSPGELSQADNDFLLRGGLRAPINAAEDVARLTKYMFDFKSPSGLLFIAKQNILSRVAPKTETSKGAAYAGGAINEGIYTPLSTLAQVGVGFSGTHLNKQGIDPTGLLDNLSIKKYDEVLKNQPVDENRLVNILSYSTRNLNGVKGYDINQGQDIITYDGGPGSILGVGKTHIKYADQRTGINNPLSDSNPQYFYKGGLVRPKTITDYNNLLGVSKLEGLDNTQTGIDPTTGTNFNLYNPDLPYSTLSKYNPTGISLTGPGGYAIGKQNHFTGETDAIYSFPIEDKLLSYKRQLLSPIKFDEGNISGESNTWAATSQDQFIEKYSSYNTLKRDYTDADVNSAGGGLWKDFNNGTKTHKEGYLADLDKNAGSWKVKGVLQQHQNNAYPGGIAPDFRKTPREKRGLYTLPITAWNDNFSNNDGETYSDYLTPNGRLQKNTLQRIYYSSNNSSFMDSKNPFSDNATDIIKFRIGIVNPKNPSDVTKLTFRAYIDNFSDSYNSEWKDQTYMGRAEKFHKYSSFDRSISLGFTVVADNQDNLNRMYEHLNTLAASIAPTYTDFGYMAGNLHQLTLGDYVVNQTGIMSGFTYEVTDETPWEINEGNQLPLYIKVSGIKFTPIHNFRPESQFNATHAFIKQ